MILSSKLGPRVSGSSSCGLAAYVRPLAQWGITVWTSSNSDIRHVADSLLFIVVMPKLTQPSIHPWFVNEDHLQLERQSHGSLCSWINGWWQVKLWHPLTTSAMLEHICDEVLHEGGGAVSSVFISFTFYLYEYCDSFQSPVARTILVFKFILVFSFITFL